MSDNLVLTAEKENQYICRKDWSQWWKSSIGSLKERKKQ